jgi:hypothetical protein
VLALLAESVLLVGLVMLAGEIPGDSLRLRDAAGRLIATGIGSSLSIPETPAGWYLLEVQAGNGRMARIPVVKE